MCGISCLWYGDHIEEVCLEQKEENPEMWELFLKMANSQLPTPEVISIIKNLKKLGYSILMMSNIGEETLKDLRFKLPYELSLFNVIQCTLQSTLQYIQKPNIAFYKFFADTHLVGKRAIFIDDKSENIAVVTSLGYTGILYEDPKQFQRELNIRRVFKGHSQYLQRQMSNSSLKKNSREKEAEGLLSDEVVELDSVRTVSD